MVVWGEGYAQLPDPNDCFGRCARIGLMSDFGVGSGHCRIDGVSYHRTMEEQPDSRLASDDSSRTVRPIQLTSKHLAIGVGVLAVFVAGDLLLPSVLGIDPFCRNGTRGRGALVEVALCCLEAGLPGLLYLLWFAAPPALLAVWLRLR